MSTPEERFEELWRNRWRHATDCSPMKPILLKIYLAATEDAARIVKEGSWGLIPKGVINNIVTAIRGE